MTTPTLEERVATLEAEVERLKQRLADDGPQDTVPWWKRIAGRYKDDPHCDEAMRLGREYRESLRPEDDEPD
jgi:hypothetical protein